MERLSILHTVEFFSPHVGGAETVVQKISEGLAGRGHGVTVGTSALAARSFGKLHGVAVEGFSVTGREADRIAGESDRYRRFLLDREFDVVMNYAAQQWATDVAFEVLGNTWSRRVNVLAPCGYSALYDDLSLRWPRFREYFERTLPVALPLYDAVVYHSPSLRDCAFGSRLGLLNGEIIRNGTDEGEFENAPAPFFRRKYGISTKAMGLCVANYLPDKGYDRIIDAVRRMGRSDFTMVCIGGRTEHLAALTKKASGLPIRFLADIPRSDTVGAYFEADIFLFASHIEASPLVIVEAKAAGLPFVSTDVGNVREYSGGLIASPERLASEANALLDDFRRRQALGAAGRKEWKESLTWSSIVDQWESLYLRLHHEKQEARKARRSLAVVEHPAPEPKKRIAGVLFSKDRPLQVDATLRSWALHALSTDRFQMTVLYTASSSRMESLYRQVRREHPGVWFVRERDFRGDLLTLLKGYEEVLFLVDDCLFVRPVPVESISRLLAADPEAIGFSLRLGENTTYCYSMDGPQRVPALTRPEDAVIRYSWPDAELDFGYPLEVSSSLYRLEFLLPLLESMEFRNPNSLESEMAAAAPRFRSSKPALLSSALSMAFCVPVTRVQEAFANRAGVSNAQPAGELAERFRSGARIDVDSLAGHLPDSCHQEIAFPLDLTGDRVPVVSVVIPCYMQAHFLEAAVESVVAQTFGDWEIVIVDDGSPDNTAGIARGLIERHPGRTIRLVRQTNGGLASARNTGVRASRGAYVLPLDSDDLIHPSMLEKCCRLLDEDPGVAIAYTDLEHFGEVQKLVRAPDFDPAGLKKGNRLNYCSMYRRTAWEDTGGYSELMSLGYEDWDFWVRCIERGLVARRIPEPLLRYRVKPNTMYGTALAHDDQLRAQVVLNNSRSYSPGRRKAAAALLIRKPLPPPTGAPVVSVVVPTRDRPHLLRETLESILGQSMKELEILVVSDAGVDIEDVVRLSGASEITRIVRHDRRRGLAAARNTALGFARGRYVAYLDDDDHYLPHHLETLLRAVRSSGLRVVYADSRRFMEVPTSGGRYMRVGESVPYSLDWNPRKILQENFIPVLCVRHERACLLESGRFDEALPNQEDWELWIRMSRRFLFLHLPIVTSEYRWRTDGSTMSSNRKKRYLPTFVRILARCSPWRLVAPDYSGGGGRPLGLPLRDLILEGVPRAVRRAMGRIRNRLSSVRKAA
jgi:glycosyltransferase involved in cell wall biosynthesis